jgi:hypothetical protein
MDFEYEFEMVKTAAREGDRARAKLILKDVIDQDPENVEAWLLLAAVVDTPRHAIRCYERVLQYDPGNQEASQNLAILQDAGEVALDAEAGLPPAASPQSWKNQPAGQQPATAGPPKKKSKSPLSTLEIILIGAVVLGLLCVSCLFLVPSGALSARNSEAAAEPTQVANEVLAVIHENLIACNAEDIERYMATIHSKSPDYDKTKNTLPIAFENFDLSYQVSGLQILDQNDREATVAFVLTTRKIRGPQFQDNQVTGQFIIRKDGDAWKIYGQKIENIEYLD